MAGGEVTDGAVVDSEVADGAVSDRGHSGSEGRT